MTHADQKMRLWDPATGKVTGTVAAAETEFWTIALSPDGKVLAAQAYAPNSPYALWKVPD